jgi:hypothetical protein
MKLHRFTHLLGVIACFAASAQSGLAEESKPSMAAPARADVAPSKAAPGMNVYIDPQTGAFLSEPAPGAPPLELSPAERDALSTSHQGLVEVPSPVPGGGVKLDLQGRFQSPLMGTVGPDGNVTMQHQQLDVPPGDKK